MRNPAGGFVAGKQRPLAAFDTGPSHCIAAGKGIDGGNATPVGQHVEIDQMARTGHILTSPQTQSISGAVLSTLWLLFAIAHLCTFGVTAKTSLLLACVHFEARQLGLTPEYSAYRNRVRWRLDPFVF